MRWRSLQVGGFRSRAVLKAEDSPVSEILELPKGFTPISKSRKSLHLGSGMGLPRPRCGLVATDRLLRGILETFRQQSYLTVCIRFEDDC